MNVEVEHLRLAYGQAVAIDDLSLTIHDGESLVLLGQSGCGKTSAMRAIAGLETPGAGRIVIDGKVVFDAAAGINLPPNKRNVGMVFQSYAVWPHRTVFQNVAFPLRVQGVAKAELDQRVMEVLGMVGLADFAGRGASLLSGGQMQRVALARSLAMRPAVLMLDEPLSNLDARLRDRLRLELRELQLRLGLTCIYVTHDQSEAFALGDRIALMQGGRIVQSGSPQEIYMNPATASMADFLGVSNIFGARIEPASEGLRRAQLTEHRLTIVSADTRRFEERSACVCIRPEDIGLSTSEPAPGASNVLPGRVLVAGFQGAVTRYAIELADGPRLDVVAKPDGKMARVGDPVWVTMPPSAVQILPDDRRA